MTRFITGIICRVKSTCWVRMIWIFSASCLHLWSWSRVIVPRCLSSPTTNNSVSFYSNPCRYILKFQDRFDFDWIAFFFIDLIINIIRPWLNAYSFKDLFEFNLRPLIDFSLMLNWSIMIFFLLVAGFNWILCQLCNPLQDDSLLQSGTTRRLVRQNSTWSLRYIPNKRRIQRLGSVSTSDRSVLGSRTSFKNWSQRWRPEGNDQLWRFTFAILQ